VRARQSVLVDGRVGRARWRAWVVSPRHDNSNESQRRLHSRELSTDQAGDRTVALAMPIRKHGPFGETCGRRERESRREGRREQSLRANTNPSRVVTVKGIPVFRKAALFAGRCQNEGLGRSVSRWRYPPQPASAPMTADVQKVAEEGNVRQHAPQSVCTRRRHERSSQAPGDASFARSFDPCTLILTTHLGAILGGGAFELVSRSGKPTQVGGNRHRG